MLYPAELRALGKRSVRRNRSKAQPHCSKNRHCYSHNMRLLILSLIVLILGGCAASGEYPSLARRTYEVAPAEPVAAPTPAPVPADAALDNRVATIVGRATAGVAGFDTAAESARAAVISAGSASPGSEPWILAQLAITRAEKLLAPAAEALADLDAEKRALLISGALSGRESVEAAIAEISALEQRQRERIQALGASISR